MIYDAQHEFSAAQSLASTAVSTNIIDLGADREIGIGEPLSVVVVVTTALDAGNSDETYTVTVQADDNSGFSSAATVVPAVSMTRGAAAGTRYVIAIPADKLTERYMRLSYTVGGTTPSGAVTAFLTASSMIQNDVYFADGITIS